MTVQPLSSIHRYTLVRVDGVISDLPGLLLSAQCSGKCTVSLCHCHVAFNSQFLPARLDRTLIDAMGDYWTHTSTALSYVFSRKLYRLNVDDQANHEATVPDYDCTNNLQDQGLPVIRWKA